jgi:hypothetical protein
MPGARQPCGALQASAVHYERDSKGSANDSGASSAGTYHHLHCVMETNCAQDNCRILVSPLTVCASAAGNARLPNVARLWWAPWAQR